MLELKTNLKQVIEPLICEALKAPLNVFAEKNYREADRNGLTTVTFRRKVAGLAAEYFAERKGNARWRGIMDQDSAKQMVIELARVRTRYSGYARTSSIHTEDITKLTRQCRSKTHP